VVRDIASRYLCDRRVQRMETTLTQPVAGGALKDALAIARYHIVLVAMTASVVFGWLMTGRYPWAIALVVGLDWFLINLLNRVTDLAEDLRNGIPGTERVARRARVLTIGGLVILFGSLAGLHFVWPWLTPFRLAVHAIGLAYNYRLIPTLEGRARLKEIYFLKNFGSACIFVLTCFLYPLAAWRGPLLMKTSAIGCLVLFFVAFEMSYEVLYDLRDLPGDREEGIPTFPVVHGPERAQTIIDALLAISFVTLLSGIALGLLGVREGLMLFAPIVQRLFYRGRVRRGLSTHDCVILTHLGTAQLVLFLVGTAVWLRLGLPPNVFLRS
jgi:4-hydroxybenzoate polyprenyltransferase